MRRRLFIYTTLIILAGLLCFFAATIYSKYDNNLSIAKDTVIETTQIFASLYSEDADLDAFVNAGSGTRVTIIASDGTVLADSFPLNPGTLETHLDRPEIQAAAKGAPSPYIRYSDTIHADLIYYALKVETGGDYVFIRTAIPVARISEYLSVSVPLLALILFAIIVLCFIISHTMIKRMTRPLEAIKQKLRRLSEGKYEEVPVTGDFEEINAIVSEIDDIAGVLQEGMNALREEKNKAGYILNNISDAIFAINADKDISLINKASQNIFNVTQEIIGKNINYLTGNRALLDAVEECVDKNSGSISELTQDGRIYLLTIKPIEGTALTMAVLSDITDSRESSRQREEFFENASHELKTPLTAIKGYNELCAARNKDKRIKKYINVISRQTERMLSLIGDMLRLSELTSIEASKITPVPVNLHDIAMEIQDTLSADIAASSLSVDISGGCEVEAEPRHVYDLLKNLIENAVRYNTEGGSVSVILQPGCLKVSDTGIGIAPEAQSRLFERFYRVEKSRSIQSGGTGLGLAIVKHICALYSWRLSLKSKPSAGTEVTVEF